MRAECNCNDSKTCSSHLVFLRSLEIDWRRHACARRIPLDSCSPFHLLNMIKSLHAANESDEILSENRMNSKCRPEGSISKEEMKTGVSPSVESRMLRAHSTSIAWGHLEKKKGNMATPDQTSLQLLHTPNCSVNKGQQRNQRAAYRPWGIAYERHGET